MRAGNGGGRCLAWTFEKTLARIAEVWILWTWLFTSVKLAFYTPSLCTRVYQTGVLCESIWPQWYLCIHFPSVYMEYPGKCQAQCILIPTDKLHHFGGCWHILVDLTQIISWETAQFCSLWGGFTWLPDSLALIYERCFENLYATCMRFEKQRLGTQFWVLSASSVCKSSRRVWMPHRQNSQNDIPTTAYGWSHGRWIPSPNMLSCCIIYGLWKCRLTPAVVRWHHSLPSGVSEL